MKISIHKKLGSDVRGTVYLSKIYEHNAITKLEKYDGNLTIKSPYIRIM